MSRALRTCSTDTQARGSAAADWPGLVHVVLPNTCTGADVGCEGADAIHAHVLVVLVLARPFICDVAFDGVGTSHDAEAASTFLGP